ncbi:hypothetical protein DFH08DRAFT_828490 [Mycena albidolilacea]|uniref:Uncharacterized protein n=1 Tax=Mycena albidolilacea TaxID=1033008 RepID=A0AAD6YVX8_9AGAR|nr:hypothetical protein DFH08DRAFT_828490 [Mycena albidolilacea]
MAPEACGAGGASNDVHSPQNKPPDSFGQPPDDVAPLILAEPFSTACLGSHRAATGGSPQNLGIVRHLGLPVVKHVAPNHHIPSTNNHIVSTNHHVPSTNCYRDVDALHQYLGQEQALEAPVKLCWSRKHKKSSHSEQPVRFGKARQEKGRKRLALLQSRQEPTDPSETATFVADGTSGPKPRVTASVLIFNQIGGGMAHRRQLSKAMELSKERTVMLCRVTA